MDEGNFWIGVVSRAHSEIGVKGGFIQLNHGKKAPLQKMKKGDWIVIYSPRTSYPEGEPLQSFTAIGEIVSDDVYQFEMSPDFVPYRMDVRYRRCRVAPIGPLIDKLSFIKNKSSWGAAFRFGQIKIARPDFDVIAQAMSCKVS
jgi:predicted RNA-binding protein